MATHETSLPGKWWFLQWYSSENEWRAAFNCTRKITHSVSGYRKMIYFMAEKMWLPSAQHLNVRSTGIDFGEECSTISSQPTGSMKTREAKILIRLKILKADMRFTSPIDMQRTHSIRKCSWLASCARIIFRSTLHVSFPTFILWSYQRWTIKTTCAKTAAYWRQYIHWRNVWSWRKLPVGGGTFAWTARLSLGCFMACKNFHPQD